MPDGMFAVQAMLRSARGQRSRREVVDRAMQIPGAPDYLSEKHLRQLDTIGSQPPADGTVLRVFAAALGIEWTDLLAKIGYWPPLDSRGAAGRSASPEAAIRDLCSRLGVRVVPGAGGRLVIELP